MIKDMKSEQKICQNCKNKFTIEPEDFDFYKKIDVPPPTFCPRCRLQRRLAWLKGFRLYKRVCDLCNKDTISMYPPDAQYVVYCHNCWWGDAWDPLEYGQEYDYKTIDEYDNIISSGVASYEPVLGGDENPFRQPVTRRHCCRHSEPVPRRGQVPTGRLLVRSSPAAHFHALTRSLLR